MTRMLVSNHLRENNKKQQDGGKHSGENGENNKKKKKKQLYKLRTCAWKHSSQSTQEGHWEIAGADI